MADNIRDRINKAKVIIFNSLDKLDKSGTNHKIYDAKFKAMSDKDFIRFCKEGIIRLYSNTWTVEPKFADAVALCSELGVPTMEDVTIPHLYKDDDIGELYADKKTLVLEFTFKRLEQMIGEENNIVTEIDSRDKMNQAIGESKAAMMSDQEVAMAASKGYDKMIVEMLTFRADSMESKEEAYNNLITTGRTTIPDTKDDPANKIALQAVHWLYMDMGIQTDLIEEIDE